MSRDKTSARRGRERRPLTRSRSLVADRGATLVFTALVTAVLLGVTALAVDLGMLLSARVQSQRAADSGALAGAQRLATSGATPTDARTEAKQYANSHNVLTNPVGVDDGDIDVVGDTVRVRVHHSIGTLFARVFGVDEVDVSTVAAAEAVPAGGAECPLPIVAVDGWDDADGDGLYDQDETYIPCPGEGCTGYNWETSGPNGIGMLMEVKSQNTSEPDPENATQTCGAEQPSWYCWMDIPSTEGSGVPELREAIDGCPSSDFDLTTGEEVFSSSGNMMSVVSYIADYIDNVESEEGSLAWDPAWGTEGCVVDGQGQCVGNSARIRPIAVVDPTTITGTGSGARANVTAFVSVFMEKVATEPTLAHRMESQPGQWNAYFRLVGSAQGGKGTDGPEGSFQQTIVLVE